MKKILSITGATIMITCFLVTSSFANELVYTKDKKILTLPQNCDSLLNGATAGLESAGWAKKNESRLKEKLGDNILCYVDFPGNGFVAVECFVATDEFAFSVRNRIKTDKATDLADLAEQTAAQFKAGWDIYK